MPRGEVMANTWHGAFPRRNELSKKHGMTTPVGRYPAKGYRLFDVEGNVWEWTASLWSASHATVTHEIEPPGCVLRARRATYGEHAVRHERGLPLCAPSYCHRYRPAAR